MRYARNIAIVVDDLRPIVTGYCLEEETDRIIDLTSAVSVKFFMYPRDEDGVLGVVKINGVAGAIDGTPTTGKVTYTWTGTDTDTEGFYIGYFVVYWGAASTIPQTFSATGIRFVSIEERMS